MRNIIQYYTTLLTLRLHDDYHFVSKYLKFVNGNANCVYLQSGIYSREVVAKEGKFGFMDSFRTKN